MAEITLAAQALMPRWTIGRAMALADKAKAQDPDNARVLSARSEILQSVGRMNDAIEDAERAAQLDPLSPLARSGLIRALAYGGSIDRARQELQRAKQLWPETRTIRESEYSLERRFGNFEQAITSTERHPAVSFYVKARRDPSDANVRMFLVAMGQDGFDTPEAIFALQALGEMDRVDDFYELAAKPSIAEAIRADSYALFRPWLAKVRRDPRFMRLAKQLGLAAYWRQSARWPDFCIEPTLPYDCKKEAAR